MRWSEQLITELRREAETTRWVLDRLPADRLSWKPHPRSMSLGQLALHIAGLPRGIAELLTSPAAEIPAVPLPEAASLEEILSALDESLRVATETVSAWRDEDLRAEWRLTSGAETILRLPRSEMVRSLMLNHWYHHRGQLTVYLRLLEVPLPQVYGPTADTELAPAADGW